eukprot:scaffold33688_cov268-Skeletonema_menzelii.AAC.1
MTSAIQQWMRSVIRRLDHYKAEHQKLLKEATTLLELALWKTNLADNEGDRLDREGFRTTRGSRKRARTEICVTSDYVIVVRQHWGESDTRLNAQLLVLTTGNDGNDFRELLYCRLFWLHVFAWQLARTSSYYHIHGTMLLRWDLEPLFTGM